MKRFLLIIPTLLFSLLAVAQLDGDGYYRVANYGLMERGNKNGVKSKVFMSITHNEGKVVLSAASADLHSLKLYEDDEHSNPQNVVYFKSVSGTNYDFSAQGVSVYSIIGYTPEIKGYSGNRYEFIGKYAGQTAYLWSNPQLSSAGFYAVTTLSQSSTDYRLWSIYPISHTTDEYFGVKPTIQVGERYFAPYYVSFPFRFASAGMKAYTITHVNYDGSVVISEVLSDVIPAATPLLIECSSANPSDNRLEILTGDDSPLTGNYLSGVYFSYLFSDSQSENKRTQFDPETMRVFAVKDGELVLTNDETLTQLTAPFYSFDSGMFLNHNESYLYIGNVSTYSDGKTIEGRTILADEDREILLQHPTSSVVTTIISGIEDVKTDNRTAQSYYTLDGKNLSAPKQGINIVRSADGSVRKVLR